MRIDTSDVPKVLNIAMLGVRGIPASFGGAERSVEELSAALVRRGHNVTVFARRAYSDPTVTAHRGVRIVHGWQVNTKHLEALSHTALALGHVMRRGGFDVVHFHATGPALLSFVPRLRRIPTVATVQGLDYRRPKWGLLARSVLGFAAAAVAFFPTRTIVVSRDLERHYAERFGAQVTYIPNGVAPSAVGDTVSVDGLLPDRFVLFLGRLVAEKEVHTLIRAYRTVETDMPLVIAGPETYSAGYVAELQALAAEDARVRLIGPMYGHEKVWLLQNACTFVLTSSIEGLPIALLEALSAGRYPIVSDIPPNIEPLTCGSEVLGTTVPVGDEAALGHALQQVLSMTAEARGQTGERLRQEVLRRYDWDAIAAQTAEVYGEAIGSHHDPASDARRD